jgi:hypothetical protein
MFESGWSVTRSGGGGGQLQGVLWVLRADIKVLELADSTLHHSRCSIFMFLFYKALSVALA